MNSNNKDIPKNIKVYYSGSIQGAPEAEPDFAWHLVQYMIGEGVDVLSEHVAGRTKEERDEIRAKHIDLKLQEVFSGKEPWYGIRTLDTKWVDEATHMVALVNAPSHGVGMEIERALLKPERGLPVTPILCLIHVDLLDKLSYMIRGIQKEEYPNFSIVTYSNLEEAKDIVKDFLTTIPKGK